jgi:hypothetical protein
MSIHIMKVYRLLNVLSIDVVSGAICCAVFFARVTRAHPKIIELVLLGMAVWIVYTMDHLLDAKRISTETITIRHSFHKKYFKPLLLAVGVLTFISIFFIPQLPRVHIISGIVLALIVLFYLVFQSQLGVIKEFLIAIGYTVGLLIPSFQSVELSRGYIALIVQFVIAAFMNLLLFAYFDLDADAYQGQTSMAQSIGKRKCRYVLVIAFAVSSYITISLNFWSPSIYVWMISVVQLFLLIFGKYFQSQERYRLIGDAAFIIPAIYFLL